MGPNCPLPKGLRERRLTIRALAADRMGLYRIENSAELQAALVGEAVAGWREEEAEVTLVTLEGARINFQRSLLALHSPLLAALLPPEASVVSLPVSQAALTCILHLLTGGEGVAAGCTAGQVREAAVVLGVTMADLTSSLVRGKAVVVAKKVQESLKKGFPKKMQEIVLPKSLDIQKVVKSKAGKAMTPAGKVGSRTEQLLAEEADLATLAQMVTDSLPTTRAGWPTASQATKHPYTVQSKAKHVKATKPSQPQAIPAKKPKQAIQPKQITALSSRVKVEPGLATSRAGQAARNARRKVILARAQARDARKGPGKLVVKQEKAEEGLPVKKVATAKNKAIKTLPVSKSKVNVRKGQPIKKPILRGKYNKTKSPGAAVKKEPAQETADDVSIEYEEREESKCPYCMKQFSSWKSVSAHMAKVHSKAK